MSLTSNLQDSSSPLFRYLADQFPNANSASEQWRAAVGEVEPTPPFERGHPYATVGTALNWFLELAFGDVRLGVATGGFTLWREVAFGQPPVQSVGSGTARFYLNQRSGRTIKRLPPGYDLFDSLRSELEAFVSEWSPRRPPLAAARREYLCRLCWALALLEQVYRGGPAALNGPLGSLGKLDGLEELLALANESGIADCCHLAEVAQIPLLDAFAHVHADQRHLDPVFAGSADIGGADADFILGGCLIDCKATIHPKPAPAELRNKWLWQLIGYAGLDYDNQYSIERVAVYLARQGRLVVWELADFLGMLSGGRLTSIDRVRSDFQAILGDDLSHVRVLG